VGWIDAQNDLWLFGGFGCSSEMYQATPNDLWKYDPSTNEWTWMEGSSAEGTDGETHGESGQYGTLGTPSATNIPSSRQGAMGWTDTNGNLWLYGGLGFDANGRLVTLDDLWEYSPSLQEWAWMGGADAITSENPFIAGVYGTLGVPSPNNYPGSRDLGITWTGANGHLGMFGGYGVDSVDHIGTPNDLWDFDPGTQEWTWESGSNVITPYVNDTSVSPAVYGMLGVPTPGATPGGRYQSQSWTRSDGTVWLFGGNFSDDMWVYGTLTDMPTFSEPAGTYTGVQSITITDATPSAVIYYTTDGSMPTTSSAVYSSSVTLNETSETLQAIAVAPGLLQSYSVSANYNLILPAAAAPAISPVTGTYSRLQTVTITDATPGAAIYYTTNGATPTTSSTQYSGVFPVSASETVEAIAIAPAYSISPEATAAITLQAATPVIAPGAGTYTTVQSVTITDSTPGASIYYTTDGSIPTVGSTLYSGPISVLASETIQAIAAYTGFVYSSIAEAKYVTNFPLAATPVLAPGSGTYKSPQTVTIRRSTPGASIYYAINSTPTTASTLYTGPFTVSPPQIVEAIAVAPGYAESKEASANYTGGATTSSLYVNGTDPFYLGCGLTAPTVTG
jgi:hypothetical protein